MDKTTTDTRNKGWEPKDGDVCNIDEIKEFRPATDWERMYFFNCMAKEGKMWDADNKKLVDYPMWDKKGDVKNSKE